MHTIADLRKSLGLSTTNQVRNRIDAIKDLLTGHLRRGPNNQILLSEAGVALLRRLQDLYDSGLTISEASDVLRASYLSNNDMKEKASPAFTQNEMNDGSDRTTLTLLEQEVSALRARLAALEARQAAQGRAPAPWWETLRGEVE